MSDNQETGNQFGTADQATRTAGGAPTQAPQSQQKWSFFGMPAQGGIGRSGNSQNLARAAEAIQAALKDIPSAPGRTTAIAKIDRLKETSLAISSIIVLVRDDVAKLTAFHTLLLEENAEGFSARTIQVNKQQIAVERYTSDAYDDKYIAFMNTVAERIAPEFERLDTASAIVPYNFDWENKNQVSTLVINAAMACISTIDNRVNRANDLNYGQYAGDAQLQMQIAFGQEQTQDYVGLPVRSDIKMRMVAVSNSAPDLSTIHNQNKEQDIAYVRGFLDLAYVRQASLDWNAPNAQSPEATQAFAMRFVMTGMENTAKMSLASQLLVLAGALGLAQDYGWRPNFNTRWTGGAQRIDTHDIGALNIEGNLNRDPSGVGGKIDTKAANFDDKARTDFLRRLLYPNLSYAIDVARSGAETWYTDVFYHAANGDQEAIVAINRAANTLTGGHFQQIWKDETMSPVMNNRELIHLGYYEDAAGVRRDIRDVDYLAVANVLGTTDVQTLIDWNESFNGEDRNEAIRIHQRRQIIQNVIGTKVTFTQLARRATFDKDWLAAFQKACIAVRMNMRVVNPELTGDFQAARSVASWFSRGTLAAQGTNGYFQHAAAGSGGFSGYNMNSGSNRHWGGQ